MKGRQVKKRKPSRQPQTPSATKKPKKRTAARDSGGAEQPTNRRIGRRVSRDEFIITTPDGFPYVMLRPTPLTILQLISPKWKNWEEMEIDEGWALVKPGRKEGIWLSPEDLRKMLQLWSEKVICAFRNLDHVQRHFHRDLSRLGRVEKKLKKPFWKELRQAQTHTYVALVRAIMWNLSDRAEIEAIEETLAQHGVGWAKLKVVRRIDPRYFAYGQAGEAVSETRARSPSKRWRKYDPSVKLISSQDAPFSDSLKKRLMKEHRKVKVPTAWETSVVKAFLKSPKAAVKKLLGADAKFVDTGLPWKALRSRILSLLIYRLAEELQAADISKNRSFMLTDRILHLLCPYQWAEPDEFSLTRVRQRYQYWSAKVKPPRRRVAKTTGRRGK